MMKLNNSRWKRSACLSHFIRVYLIHFIYCTILYLEIYNWQHLLAWIANLVLALHQCLRVQEIQGYLPLKKWLLLLLQHCCQWHLICQRQKSGNGFSVARDVGTKSVPFLKPRIWWIICSIWHLPPGRVALSANKIYGPCCDEWLNLCLCLSIFQVFIAR